MCLDIRMPFIKNLKGLGGGDGKKEKATPAAKRRRRALLLISGGAPLGFAVAAVMFLALILVLIFGGGATQNGANLTQVRCTINGTVGADGSPSLVGGPTVSKAQFVAWWTASGHPNPQPRGSSNPQGAGSETVRSITDLYWQEGLAESIRPDVAEVQMIEETGSWSNSDSINGNNPAGINHYDSAASGSYFASAQLGIRGQMQRLKQVVYGNSVPLANPLVATMNGTPLSNWGGRKITVWGDMGGTVNGVVTAGGWATDPDYWKKLNTIWTSVLDYAKAHGGLGGSAPAAPVTPTSPAGNPDVALAASVCGGEQQAVSGSAAAVVQWAAFGDGIAYDMGTGTDINSITGAHDCHGKGLLPSCKLALEDCSGYTQWVFWNALGVDITRDTRSQLANATQKGWVQFQTDSIVRDQARLKVGDLIYYGFGPTSGGTTHVAIYIGNGRVNNARDYGLLSAIGPIYNQDDTMSVVRVPGLSK